MPTRHPTKTATMERICIEPGRHTSFFLWRADIDLLRALYRGSPGGYSTHVRAAVHAMCDHLRAELRKSAYGRALLARLNQLEPPANDPR